MKKTEWLRCPVCGKKTREKIREDTVYLLRICVQNLAGTILILEGDSVWAYC